MHASVDVHLEIKIQELKTLPLGTVGPAVTGLNIEERIVEELVESADAQLTESFCDEKYEHGYGKQRY